MSEKLQVMEMKVYAEKQTWRICLDVIQLTTPIIRSYPSRNTWLACSYCQFVTIKKVSKNLACRRHVFRLVSSMSLAHPSVHGRVVYKRAYNVSLVSIVCLAIQKHAVVNMTLSELVVFVIPLIC